MWMNCEYELRWKHASSDMWFTSSKHLNDEPQRSKHSFFLFFFFFSLSLSLSFCLAERHLGAPGRGLTGQPLFFLGQFFLHGRPSRPPTYLVATPGIWCFEQPRSSADSDRQGLCVLSVWERQKGPGICFQLLSLRRRGLARGDVALHTDTENKPASVESDWKISLSAHCQCPAITSWKWSSQCDSSDMMELAELIHATEGGS